MKRADYARIARFYDEGRGLTEQNMEMWLDLIRQRSGAEEGAAVLDLGCGTGRFAIPMARRLGFRVTGADLSQEMLEKAASKDPAAEVAWERVEAAHLPYLEASFDTVWMSHLLHHVGSPAEVVGGCYRVIRSSGTLLVRYGAIEQIVGDVEHRLFPEVTSIDEARTPSVQDVEAWLGQAGFQSVESVEVVQETYPDAQAHLRAARARSTSVLTLISPAAFAEGIKRLEEHVRADPDDPWLRIDRMSLTVGVKPCMEPTLSLRADAIQPRGRSTGQTEP